MKIDWRAIAHLGVKVVSVVATAVPAVETYAAKVGLGSGATKQNAVVAMVQDQVSQAFAGFDPLLLLNPRVVDAIRAVIDSVVALQQTIAGELDKHGNLPAPPAALTREP